MFIRAEKNKNYSVINNTCFKDPKLSARAKGIFAYLMSLPDDWELKKYELYKHFKEGHKAIDTAFKELETSGYVEKSAHRLETGKFSGWNYIIHEKPTNHKTDLPKTDESVNGHADNCQELLSTELPSTELLSTNKETSPPKNDKFLYLSEGLKKRILIESPSAKIADTQLSNWANDFRLMVEQDKRSLDFIKSIIIGVFNDKFWKKNIRSAGKLREKLNEGKLDEVLKPATTNQEPSTPRRRYLSAR